MGFPVVHLNEEVMREGMQIESVDITVADKIRLLNVLSLTGIEQIEVGSFVSARYTPQMADIEKVILGFQPQPNVRYTALALNAHGFERMKQCTPPLQPSLVPPMVSSHLCDTFVRRNTNRSQAEEEASWPEVIERAKRAGVREAGIALGAAWGSNFEGQFSLEQRMATLRRQHAMWDDAGIAVTWLMLADPMSWCMPHWVEEQLRVARAEWPDLRNYYLHLHNGRGMAVASIYAALRALDERHALHLDVSLGGVGGCPYCGNGRATGMAPTEDVVHMLTAMGIPTGVDLRKLIEAGQLLDKILSRSTMGHVSKVGWFPGPDELYDPNLPLVESHHEAMHFLLGPEVLADGRRPWREPISDVRSRTTVAPEAPETPEVTGRGDGPSTTHGSPSEGKASHALS